MVQTSWKSLGEESTHVKKKIALERMLQNTLIGLTPEPTRQTASMDEPNIMEEAFVRKSHQLTKEFKIIL